LVSEITEAVTSAIGDYGLYAVFLLMLVDAVLPAASEIVMLYAGAVASGAFAGQTVTLFGEPIESTGWAYVAMALAGTIGYLLGSVLGWGIGWYGGRPYLERHGRWLHMGPERLDRAEAWFVRWGDAFVLVGRVLPVVRSFISIPAGVAGMRLGRFTLLSIPGSALWCFAIAGVGVALGTSWEQFHHGWRYADYIVLGALLAGGLYLAWRVRQKRARRRAVEPSG
jgi:membrane protein DedA with SNARE-associated domain